MDSPIRASPPQQLHLGSASASSTPKQTPTSHFDSPTMFYEKQRTDSYSSADSSNTTLYSSSPTSKPANGWVKPAPTVNVYTTCGRHTDQLLFGGPSLRSLARSVIKRR